MSDTLANKIAAGEVVQRPASVAKELIENAVDAGASSIELIVKDAGSTLVQVVDDGCGMSRADAKRCFDRHATSKIRSIEDLDRIRTLGFRGEALASIASIAQVDLKTRRVEDDTGTEVRVEGGDLQYVRPCAAPSGTSIAVRNLFYNVPARRNFLKTPSTELKHLTDTFRFLALANPSVAFRMTHKDRPLYDVPAADASRGSLDATEKRVVDLLELDDSSPLLRVQDRVQDDTGELSVKGLVFDPSVRRRKRKSDQFLFVNGRYVTDRYLSHAVRTAYGDLLPEKTFPFFALFLDMDPRRVDVNVHPTKAEVKFEDESGMYGFLKSAVRQALASAHQTPQFRPSSGTEVSPASPSETSGAPSAAPSASSRDSQASPPSSSSPNRTSPPPPAATDSETAAETGGTNAASGVSASSSVSFRGTPSSFQPRQGSSGRTSGATRRSSASDPSASVPEAGTFTHELYRRPDEDTGGEPSIGPVWSLHGRFLLTPTRHGLLVINQRAAHIRVLYEEALSNLKDEAGESQQLLFPQVIDLEPTEEAMLDEWLPELEALGFDVERMSGRSISVRGVPVHIRDEDESSILQDVLEMLREDPEPVADKRAQHMARALAQKSAVPQGTELPRAERRSLIRRLMACEMPYADPTGTPTTLDLSLEEIEKRFRDSAG
jgi:DNA mismatch repair protein MutL